MRPSKTLFLKVSEMKDPGFVRVFFPFISNVPNTCRIQVNFTTVSHCYHIL